VPAPQQRLIYKGRILKDDQTLASYGACTSFLLTGTTSMCVGAIWSSMAWLTMWLVS
jgi:hypothetical protein